MGFGNICGKTNLAIANGWEASKINGEIHVCTTMLFPEILQIISWNYQEFLFSGCVFQGIKINHFEHCAVENIWNTNIDNNKT